jgi:hypothetical protein
MKILLRERQLKKIVTLLTEDTYPGANAYQIQKFLVADGWLPYESDIDGDFKDYSAKAFVRYYYGINEDKKTDTLLKLFDRLSGEKEYKEKLGNRTKTPFGHKMAKVLSDIIKKVGYKNAKERDIDYKSWSKPIPKGGAKPISFTKKEKEVLDQYGVGGLRTDKEAEKTLLKIFGGKKDGLFGPFYGPNADMTKFTNDVLSKFNCLGKNSPLAMSLWIIWQNRDKVKKSMGMSNDQTVLTIMKYAIGITQRETKMGKTTTNRDDFAEMVRSMGLGTFAPDGQSLGVGQFTKDTWYEYGLDKIVGEYNYSFNWGKQILAIMYRIWKDYKLAISKGVGTMPSVNPITKKRVDAKRKAEGKKKMFTIDGSGNVSLDLAILAHNMGPGKIQKYCKTNNENFAGPCNQKTYRPYDKGNPKDVGELTVYQTDWIEGYFPNLGHGEKTSIGYVEEVQKAYENKTQCLSFALDYSVKAPAMLEPKYQKREEEILYKIMYNKLSPEQKKRIPETPPNKWGGTTTV